MKYTLIATPPLILAGLLSGLSSGAKIDPPARSTFDKEGLPYFKEFCLSCHSTEKKEGEFDIEVLFDLSKSSSKGRSWRKIVEMVDSGEMPPKEAKQPTQERKKQFRTWLGKFLDEEARAKSGDPGRVVLRRLNNAEYTYSIADLTGVDLKPAREFPVDSAAGEGFTNTGNALVMSPALLSKYLDAAKSISNHLVLLPDGFQFSRSTTRRDWTNETLDQIRAIYHRHTEAQGASQVNLQGIVFDTNSGGRLPVAKFLGALLLEKEALSQGKKTIKEVAKIHHLNAKYLSILWAELNNKKASPLIKQISEEFWAQKSTNPETLANRIKEWQSALVRFQSVGHLKPWMVAVEPILSRQDFRVKLEPEPGSATVKVRLSVADFADGNEQDFAVWDRPRLIFPGRPEILLRDLPVLAQELKEKKAKLFSSSAQALQAAQYARTQAKVDLAAIAKKFNLEEEILKSWFDFLGIGSSPSFSLRYFKDRQEKLGGYTFVKGWGLGELPSLVANSSDQHVRIPGNMKGNSIAVHPSPTLQAAAGWQSPTKGGFTLEARITHAHPECGNGVTWALEWRSGSTRQKLASGIAHGSTEVKVGPIGPIDIEKGDLISLLIGPRDGNHSCDLTNIDLIVKSQGDSGKVWSLAREVSPDVHAGNPQADSNTNPGVWHFYAEPVVPGGDSGSVIPAGSLLAKWQAESDPVKKQNLAKAFQDMLLGVGSQAKSPADQQLKEQFSSLSGPLYQGKSNSGNLNKPATDSVAKEFGIPGSIFGSHPDGSPVDPSSICVKAPRTIELTLPADLVRGAELVTSCFLHPATAGEGSVQAAVLMGNAPQDLGRSPNRPLLVKNPSQTRNLWLQSFEDFRRLFPAALCYPKIVPVDEVVTLALFHREDDHLIRLMLNEKEKEELDRLWGRLHYISQDALTLVDAYNQLMEYATQDSDPRQFEPFRKPIMERAAKYKEELISSQPSHLEALLRFAEKAYRRPLNPGQKTELKELYLHLRKKDLPHEESIRLTLARVLVSPHFLYKGEVAKPTRDAHPVDSWELASRLSFFLWSSLPDEELRQAAADGRLTTTDGIKEQARRMLKDPKAKRLAREFATQWIHVYGLENLDEKSEKHFPSFPKLKDAMVEEALLFFLDLFQNDLSVLSVLDADHTFLNEELAKHYGIPGVVGPHWRRVDGIKSHGRGGILGMAATLAKQSGASRTSPILRGNWISEVVLGEKLPRPPKNVPQLPEDEASTQGLTVRQLTERHSSDPKCAFCHVRVDQFGFSLEGFDAIGRKRKKDLGNRPIETQAKLRDGTEFTGLEGLRHYLTHQRKDDYLKQFCKKLLGYALGRETQLSDEPILALMKKRMEANQYRFSSALEVILESRQFLDIRGKDYPDDQY